MISCSDRHHTSQLFESVKEQFDFSEYREKDWQNVLTCHDKVNAPYLWSYANHTISKILVENLLKQVKVTSVAVSQCGNFGVMGYENGSI